MQSVEQTSPERSSAWTLPILCAGIAFLACCLIIPAADENRRLTWEREKLRDDHAQIEKQLAINTQFLHSVSDDPTLLERLAQRQMKLVRQGTSVLDLKQTEARDQMSPYLLLAVPSPAPQPIYTSVGGVFSKMCLNSKMRLNLIGAALLMIAVGLIMGETKREAQNVNT